MKEFYEKSVKEGIKDYKILLRYQDGGGVYSGNIELTKLESMKESKEVVHVSII